MILKDSDSQLIKKLVPKSCSFQKSLTYNNSSEHLSFIENIQNFNQNFLAKWDAHADADPVQYDFNSSSFTLMSGLWCMWLGK